MKKVIDFGYVVRKIRRMMNVSQSQFVSCIDNSQYDFSGVDAVTISRWENGVINPSHRRQVELLKSLDLELHDIVDSGSFNLNRTELELYLMKYTLKDFPWDFCDEQTEKEYTAYQVISDSSEENKSIVYSCNTSGIPLAQVTYNIEQNNINEGDTYLVVKSLSCGSKTIFLEIISYIFKYVLSKKVMAILFYTNNKSSPTGKVFKKLGFNLIKKEHDKFVNIITIDGIVYNRELFLISCKDKSQLYV